MPYRLGFQPCSRCLL